ncbi:MAG TPA: PD-(D/E)XK nuclease family protein [Nitrospirales bacterium]|nr:PD-(D/E)XK nuclease family protein [Nitrospirales bacterium]
MDNPITPVLTLCDGWKGVQAHLLHSLTTTLAHGPLAIRNVLILVPTTAAGHVLELALEHDLLKNRAATILPSIATIHVFLEDMASRSLGKVTNIDPLLRQAILEKSLGEAAESGFPPPFLIRRGLPRRILSLYDHMCLAGHTVDAFAQRALEEFNAPDDAGAERMAQQTRFLVESLTRYRTLLTSLQLNDAVTLHQSLLDHGVRSPYSHILVLGPETIRPGDLAYLTAAPAVETVEIIAPASMEKHSSLRALTKHGTSTMTHAKFSTPSPILFTPDADDEVVFTARDREEVLISITKLLKVLAKNGTLPEINRIAVVVPTPLPYLYLAKQVFGQAGIPYQLQDGFPLTTEPYLAAIDLLFDFIEHPTEYSPSFQLLLNPFFEFPGVSEHALVALETELQTRNNIHGNEAWARMRNRSRQQPVQLGIPGLEGHNHSGLVQNVLETIHTLEHTLTPMASPTTPMTTKINGMRDFLTRYERTTSPHDDAPRHNRARGALLTILDQLENVDRVLGESPVEFHTFRKTLHDAVQSHTFSERTGDNGIHIIDARSAALGMFDLVILVGLNEGEWPSRRDHNIFYPQWLLQDFGWPSDFDSLSSERIAFKELIRVSRRHVAVFRHQLEEDAPTISSPFLEDIEDLTAAHTQHIPARAMNALVTSRNHALRSGLVQPDRSVPKRPTPGILEQRLPKPEPVSATAFELYLRCPFKYYAKYILHLDEEDEIHMGFSPLQRGRIVHEILKEGFQQWDATADVPQPYTEENYDQAVSLFRRIAKEKIPRKYHSIELARLFGSHGHVGAIEWVLRQEMTRGPVAKRFVEHPFRTNLRLEYGPNGESPWHVDIKGRVDRVDIDLAGRIHVFDYKTGKAPESKVTLQVPLYAMCLAQDFSAETTQATYLSLRDRKAVRRDDYEKTATQLRETYRLISEGHFPPRPYQDHLCNSCGYIGLCRKEISETALPTEVQEVKPIT